MQKVFNTNVCFVTPVTDKKPNMNYKIIQTKDFKNMQRIEITE